MVGRVGARVRKVLRTELVRLSFYTRDRFKFGVYCHYLGIKLKTVVRSGRPNLRKFQIGAGNETLTRGLILGKDAL